MANCRQACPYNTLDGCKVKEYNAICPLTNMATPVTEYRMTNGDRIRALSDKELGIIISEIVWEGKCIHWTDDAEKWLQEPDNGWVDRALKDGENNGN